MKPLLIVTMGDINGVGPEILAKALADDDVWSACVPVVAGCPRAYADGQRLVSAGPDPVPVDEPADARRLTRGKIGFLADSGTAPDREPGRLTAEAGRCAMVWVERATTLVKSGAAGGIVTCPIQKEGIRLAGYTVSGHTDYIAKLTNAPEYWMSLFTDTMRIVHISGHLSLRAALDLVKRDRIARAIRAGDAALTRLGAGRRIGVAGLNPHAGEGGAFGTEDREEIFPAVEACRAEGIDCSGPHPADTIFRRMQSGEFDLVVAMYHDQGHIPLKLVAMETGVNVTLGIPIVRTSVDHGTAYDIAGTGVADEHSLCEALKLAARLAEGS